MIKSKLNVLAAAVAMAASAFGGNAMAGIATAGSGNSELYLTVWDQVGNKSYTRDLGVFLDSYGTQNAPGAFTTNVDASPAFTQPFNADANWTTFVGTSTAADVANWKWSVVGGDFSGTSAANGFRLVYSSLTDDQARAAEPGTLVNNTGLSTVIGKQDNFISNLNQADTAPAANNSYIVTDPTRFGYAGYLDGSFSSTAAALNPFATVGTGMNFIYATRSGSPNSAEATFRTYGTAAGGPSQWLLGANGNLTFAASVAPIPEPGEWAMLLAGLAVVGSIARRRLSSHA